MEKNISSNRYNRKKTPSPNQTSISSAPKSSSKQCWAPKVYSNGERIVVHFEGYFRQAIWPVLLIGQLFAVMPVAGIKSRSVSDVCFKWTHFRTIYTLFVMAILISYTLLVVWKTFSGNVGFSSIAYLLFYMSNSFGMICFLRLAIKWPALMRYWEVAESQLPTFRNQKHRRNFILKLRTFAFTILVMALVENTLSVVSLLHYVVACQPDKDPIMELLNIQFTHLFPSGHKILVLIIGKFINVCATFVWNFLDVFIMMVSIGLSTMFKLYNDDLRRAKGENNSVDYWMYRRSQYGKLRDLVETVDEEIAQLTLLSFSNVLFFTCKTIFLGIRPMPTYLRTIYFSFSIVFLILRAVAVSLSAASIHDESKEPINVLYTVPSYSWNPETKRFFDEIIANTVALSGMKFFFLTRKMILSLAATVATYELVLMQFGSKKTPIPMCDIAVNKTI